LKRLLVLAPLFLFGVAGSFLLWYFFQTATEGAFQNNLLPELFGFCLEGFFILGLFSMLQLRLERERKNELRLSLRSALREILSHMDIALLEENAEPADSQSLEQDPKLVRALFVKLHKGKLELGSLLNIKEAAARNVGTMQDLIPVAAQLSPDHMRWWLAITESARNLSEAKDRANVDFAAQKFLMNLGEFDMLPL
jgi:hypothetical protein